MKHSTPINNENNMSDANVATMSYVPRNYVPRDFFTNNHLAIEDAIGFNEYAEVLYEAGYKSAYHWCEKEAKLNHLSGIAVFEHYLNRLSQRGWGVFSFESVNVDTGNAEVKLEYSSFVLSQPEKPGKLCNMFAGWFAGAMDWCTTRKGHYAYTNCEGIDCAAQYCSQSKCGDSSESFCIFTIKPSVTNLAAVNLAVTNQKA
jgi:predicted hydrocarbon binding protein